MCNLSSSMTMIGIGLANCFSDAQSFTCSIVWALVEHVQ